MLLSKVTVRKLIGEPSFLIPPTAAPMGLPAVPPPAPLKATV